MGNFNKDEIRQKYILLRKTTPRTDRDEKSKEICIKLRKLHDFIISSTIFVYLSMPEEVSTDMIIKQALDSKKVVTCPVVCKKQGVMKAAQLYGLDHVVPGAYGIREPEGKSLIIQETKIDLAIVPGVVFDKKGARIGYGGGYYDKFLPKLKKNTAIIALAFDLQIVNNITQDEYDVPVDIIITEQRIIYI